MMIDPCFFIDLDALGTWLCAKVKVKVKIVRHSW